MIAVAYPLRFQAGARTFLVVRRRLWRIAFTLPAALAGEVIPLPPLNGADGYIVTSLPQAMIDRIGGHPLLSYVRQRYTRYFADFGAGFQAYMAHFSGKTRSTLNRKRKHFTESCGGTLDIRSYRTPDEIKTFAALATSVSRKSYQHRLLDAGLPEDAEARAEMTQLAASDRVRAFLLFRNGQPIAYLYLPVIGDVLIYAYLGYDPAEADLSPGTVLQLEAIRMLADEDKYTRLDFTEGEGQHKKLFATGGVDCAEVLLLRPTLTNRLILRSLRSFDGLVSRLGRLSNNNRFAWLKALRR
jgi:CelD/BcsL family acetyltransferase involved in cellulose biosynthesis